MATEKPRYSITLDEKTFQEIEDFRYEYRYPNRNQATVRLIRLGLEALKEKKIDEDYIYGEAAAYGGDSSRVKTTKEKLKKYHQMTDDFDE